LLSPLKKLILAIAESEYDNIFAKFLVLVGDSFSRTYAAKQLLLVKALELYLGVCFDGSKVKEFE
jgi:hypothetical protein